VAYLSQAVPATVLTVSKGREIVRGLLSPTAIADGHAIPNTLVPDLMETTPDQVRAHDAKADARPSRHLAQGQTGAEQIRNLIHPHYLKRKQ